jgi:hypothetical protein
MDFGQVLPAPRFRPVWVSTDPIGRLTKLAKRGIWRTGSPNPDLGSFWDSRGLRKDPLNIPVFECIWVYLGVIWSSVLSPFVSGLVMRTSGSAHPHIWICASGSQVCTHVIRCCELCVALYGLIRPYKGYLSLVQPQPLAPALRLRSRICGSLALLAFDRCARSAHSV